MIFVFKEKKRLAYLPEIPYIYTRFLFLCKLRFTQNIDIQQNSLHFYDIQGDRQEYADILNG